jgi:hypothetical protein
MSDSRALPSAQRIAGPQEALPLTTASNQQARATRLPSDGDCTTQHQVTAERARDAPCRAQQDSREQRARSDGCGGHVPCSARPELLPAVPRTCLGEGGGALREQRRPTCSGRLPASLALQRRPLQVARGRQLLSCADSRFACPRLPEGRAAECTSRLVLASCAGPGALQLHAPTALLGRRGARAGFSKGGPNGSASALKQDTCTPELQLHTRRGPGGVRRPASGCRACAGGLRRPAGGLRRRAGGLKRRAAGRAGMQARSGDVQAGSADMQHAALVCRCTREKGSRAQEMCRRAALACSLTAASQERKKSTAR